MFSHQYLRHGHHHEGHHHGHHHANYGAQVVTPLPFYGAGPAPLLFTSYQRSQPAPVQTTIYSSSSNGYAPIGDDANCCCTIL